ncbi:MAG: hypothetical protein OJK14_02825, partial [Achromobacter sp.]|uniref:hypothetical protein n=1 Tax=Achromobacter sp. TaxID=134375 RepID=UPI002587959B
ALLCSNRGRRHGGVTQPNSPPENPVRFIPHLERADQQIVNYYGRKVGSVRNFFQRVQGKDGLPDWVIAKSIRHTMAKHARAAGVDDWQVSGQLGHRKPGRSTTEVYAKYDPAYLSETRRFTDDFVCQLQKLVRRSLEPR